MQRTESTTPVGEEHSRESIADGTAGIAFILFEDNAHQGKLISDLRTHFQQRETPVEFLIVSSNELRLAPLSEAQQTRSVRSLDAAIRCSKFDNFAIIDSVYDFDERHWSIVAPRQDEAVFRSWSFRPTRAPGSRRFIAWIYCYIIRLLFRVRKNRLAPGIVTFTRHSLSDIDLHRFDQESADCVSQLLATAKLKGHRLEENHCGARQTNTAWTKTNSTEPHFPISKSIKFSIKRNLQFWFSDLAFPARPSKSSQSFSSTKNIAISLLIFLIAAMLLLANSSYPLFEPDETRNAQLAMNILDSGNWSALTLHGEPYWDKPPLLAWMTAVSYQCFGVNEFATRLPSIIGSILLLVFVTNAGAKLIGFRPAAFGAIALLLAWGFTFQSRYVTMDALLTLFTTVVTLGIAAGVTPGIRRRFSRPWFIASGIALGLGILAKGPICIVLTAPPIVAWLFLNRQVSKGTVVAAAKLVSIPAALIAAPWFILTTIRTPEFVWHFIWKHHVLRFSDAFVHQEPFWFYVPILWLLMFPASILLPRTVQFIISDKGKYRHSRLPAHGLLAMSACWIIGFFSVSECKLPAYILPAFPMIALLTGVIFNFELSRHTTSRSRFDRLPKRIAIGVCLLSVVAASVMTFQFGGRETSWAMVLIVVAIIILAVLYPARRSTTRNRSWLATAAIGLLFVSLGMNLLVPSIASDRSILKSLSQQHARRPSNPVVYFGRDSFSSKIYLPNAEVVQIDEEAMPQMEAFLFRNPQSTIVASDANIDRVQDLFGSDIVIEKAPGRHTFYASVIPARSAAFRSENQTQK